MSHSLEKSSSKKLIVHIIIDIFLILLVVMIILSVKSCKESLDLKHHYSQLLISLKNHDYSKAQAEFRYFREQNQENYENVNVLEKKFVIDELKRTYAALPENEIDKRLNVCRSLYRLEPFETIHKDCVKKLEEKVRARNEESAFKEKRKIMVADLKKSERYITKFSYIGAVSKSLLRKAMKVLSQGDKAAFEKFLQDNQPHIFILKHGEEVLLEDTGGISSEYVKVRSKRSSVSFWTSRHALENPK